MELAQMREVTSDSAVADRRLHDPKNAGTMTWVKVARASARPFSRSVHSGRRLVWRSGMSDGEVAFLVLVIGAMVAFAAVLAWVSRDARGPQ